MKLFGELRLAALKDEIDFELKNGPEKDVRILTLNKGLVVYMSLVFNQSYLSLPYDEMPYDLRTGVGRKLMHHTHNVTDILRHPIDPSLIFEEARLH